MLIIGCDYHPGVQQIAFMDTETGEFGERRLEHGEREGEKFYRDLQQTGISVRVGMEATGHARWFAVAGGTALRVMDWGSLGDSGHAGAEARDRSPRCATIAEAPAGRPLSPNLGGELGKSGSATTSVASASFGADAHTNQFQLGSSRLAPQSFHESVASRGLKRGSAAKDIHMRRRLMWAMARITLPYDRTEIRNRFAGLIVLGGPASSGGLVKERGVKTVAMQRGK
jgi:hypothetical protein